MQSWGELDAAKAQIEATTAQVRAAEITLTGVREEARVGGSEPRLCPQRAAGSRECACGFCDRAA